MRADRFANVRCGRTGECGGKPRRLLRSGRKLLQPRRDQLDRGIRDVPDPIRAQLAGERVVPVQSSHFLDEIDFVDSLWTRRLDSRRTAAEMQTLLRAYFGGPPPASDG